MFSSQDTNFMRHALGLAARGMGHTWPNPFVGCVIVRDGVVVGRGRTAKGGRPHAEVVALKQADGLSQGATAYVSLEPCAHHGQTPPCTSALIQAGIKRIVIACHDPDPRVSGQGVQQLRDAGVEVTVGVLEAEALALQKGFIDRVMSRKPLVTLKIATARDGVTIPPDDHGRWITGEPARRHTHLQRSGHDAVLAGIETVLADDPMLTARLPGLDHETVRVVLDTHLRLPRRSNLVRTATQFPLYVLYKAPHNGKTDKAAALKAALEKAGAKVFPADVRDLNAVLEVLADQGITRLFVEGGASVITSFLEAGVWDRFLWYRSSYDIGEQGRGRLDYEDMADRYGLKRMKTRSLGEDTLEIYGKSI